LVCIVTINLDFIWLNLYPELTRSLFFGRGEGDRVFEF